MPQQPINDKENQDGTQAATAKFIGAVAGDQGS